jgi:hypothetical protein
MPSVNVISEELKTAPRAVTQSARNHGVDLIKQRLLVQTPKCKFPLLCVQTCHVKKKKKKKV